MRKGRGGGGDCVEMGIGHARHRNSCTIEAFQLKKRGHTTYIQYLYQCSVKAKRAPGIHSASASFSVLTSVTVLVRCREEIRNNQSTSTDSLDVWFCMFCRWLSCGKVIPRLWNVNVIKMIRSCLWSFFYVWSMYCAYCMEMRDFDVLVDSVFVSLATFSNEVTASRQTRKKGPSFGQALKWCNGPTSSIPMLFYLHITSYRW